MIALAGAAIVAATIWGVVMISISAATAPAWLPDAGMPAVSEGEPGVHEATRPVVCPTDCLGTEGADHLTPTTLEGDSLGISSWIGERGDGATYSSEDAFDSAIGEWIDFNGMPTTCAFLNSWLAISVSREASIREQGELRILKTWFDDMHGSMLSVATAVFPDSETAQRRLVEIAEHVEQCHEYTIDGFDGEPMTSSVRPAPKLERIDPSISWTGWSEVDADVQYYTYELQRGEIAVRVTLQTYGVLDQSAAEVLTRNIAGHLADQPLGEG